MKISRFADEPIALVLGQAEATLSVSEMCCRADTRRRDHGPRVHAAFPATNALLPSVGYIPRHHWGRRGVADHEKSTGPNARHLRSCPL
jgi:hypothetical protein